MAHQRTAAGRIRPHILPVPEDSEIRQQYLDLGWQQFPGLFKEELPYLKWPYDLRSPEYPGEVRQPEYHRPLLNDLPPTMIEIAQNALPFSTSGAGEVRDVEVVVTIRFESKYVSGRAARYSFAPVEAAMRVRKEGA